MNIANEVVFLIFRGKSDISKGELKEYRIEISEGMVVLDAIRLIQSKYAFDLAIRCNCRAGKCGACAAEINGIPRLMCKTQIADLPLDKPIIVRPLKAFPIIKDLVTDVSWNYDVNKLIPPFRPKTTDLKMYQEDVERVHEFRKCIECFLCQNTCHVIREHDKKDVCFGPRFFVRLAGLEMHPFDTEDRLPLLKERGGLGYCNITKCCTEVCPESIKITDNAIIPLKERLIDRYYDPLKILFRKLFEPRE